MLQKIRKFIKREKKLKFTNQNGQIIPVELLMVIAATLLVAVMFIIPTEKNVIIIDKHYQTEMKSFFLQGE